MKSKMTLIAFLIHGCIVTGLLCVPLLVRHDNENQTLMSSFSRNQINKENINISQ